MSAAPATEWWRHLHSVRQLGAVILVLVLLWGCLTQSLSAPRVPIGGDPQTGRRGMDTPFLRGFWGAEPAEWDRTSSSPYRWTEPSWRIRWPFAGRGWFVQSVVIDTTGWQATDPHTLTWQQPALGAHATPAAVRRYHVLSESSGVNLDLAVTSEPLATATDRRALGVILRNIGYSPLIGAWQPAAGAGLLLVLLLGYVGSAQCWGKYRVSAALSAGTVWTLVVVGLPLWWPVHSTALLVSLLVAGVSGIAAAYLLIPRSAERARWGWAIAAAMFFPLLALNSPYLLSSDSAMHARMLFDVLRGNLYQVAELPCEAGASTVPYPPLVYLLAGPFALLTWDRDTAAHILQNGAVVAHTLALVYLWQTYRRSPRCDAPALVFLAVASVSLPFLQAVHIGELTNAWGHALLIVVVASWDDARRSEAFRTVLLLLALCSHTGIALSIGLVLAVRITLHTVTNRQVPWTLARTGLFAGVGAGLIYYSCYVTLIGQAAKYAGCPPQIPILTRLTPVLTTVPLLVVALGLWGVWQLRRAPVHLTLYSVLGATIFSIAVLLFKTQTVRWGMAVVPFLALAVGLALAAAERPLLRRTVVLVAAVIVGMSYWGLWERVMHYLH